MKRRPGARSSAITTLRSAVRCRADAFLLFSLLLLIVMPVALDTAASSLPPLQRLVPGQQAVDFVLPQMGGGELSLQSLRGQVVVINFWASWCAPCRYEIPALERAWQQLRSRGVVLLAVATQDDPGMVARFLERNPVTFPVLLDETGEVARTWPFSGIPATFVIDPDGRLVYRAMGVREWDSQPVIQQILALRQGLPE